MSESDVEPALQTARSGPSRAWYAVTFVPFLLCLIPAYVLGRAAADEVEVRLDVLTDRTVDIDDDDRSIYAASQELSERARCTLRSVTGETTALDERVSHLSTEQDGTTWYRVAPLPAKVEAGTYVLRCQAGGGAVEPTSLAVSTSPRWGRFALLLLAAFGIPVAAAVLGALVLVALIVMRRRAQRTEEESTSPFQLE